MFRSPSSTYSASKSVKSTLDHRESFRSAELDVEGRLDFGAVLVIVFTSVTDYCGFRALTDG